MKLRDKIKRKEEKKEIENNEEEDGKVFSKSFTKKKKKIGLPIVFEDSQAKVEAQVLHDPLISKGLIQIILSEISCSDVLIPPQSLGQIMEIINTFFFISDLLLKVGK